MNWGQMSAVHQPQIVVVGSTMTDMVTYAQRIPERGQTLLADSFVVGFGGKGANQATMARRFGIKVAMVNTLGDDLFGDSTLQNFESQGINTEFIRRAPGPSGVAPIWVEPDGTNRILIVPGANNLMTEEQSQSAIEGLGEISVVVGQLEIPQNVTAAAFKAAQAKGIPTILNPAPYSPITPELLAVSDWVMPNESEFAAMHPEGLAPTSDAIIAELASRLNTRFAVTLGEAGAAFTTTDGTVIRVSPPKVTAIDTTGAGDALVGSFAVGLALGLSDEAAIKLGCLCATDSVTRLGTQASYPSPERVQELLQQL
jgi:ribokinase